MLNDDDGMFFRQRLEQPARLRGLFVRHAGDRLIDQQQFRILQNDQWPDGL